MAKQGGGALVLQSGTYHLDRPIILSSDNVVIRGQGADKTRLVFRYGPPDAGVGFFQLQNGATVGPKTPIEVHAEPEGLQRIAISVADRVVVERARHKHWGGTFMQRTFGSNLGNSNVGPRQLKAIAEWSGGRRAEARITVQYDPEHEAPASSRQIPSVGLAAIMFFGGTSRTKWKLAKDGNRGDLEIVLKEEPDLRPGDAIELDAPATARWNGW